VAEASKIGNYRRGELLRCMDGGANPLMDRKVVGVVLFGVVAAWVNEILRKNAYVLNMFFVFQKTFNIYRRNAKDGGRQMEDQGCKMDGERRTEMIERTVAGRRRMEDGR